MRKPIAAAPEIVYDPSSRYFRNSFTSRSHKDEQEKPLSRISSNQQESTDERMDINKILKEIQYLGSSTMTWKERKKLENEKVIALGGKVPKKHLVPLSVGKPQMKNQRKREQKIMDEEQILGRFTRRSNNRNVEKRKTENRVLKSSGEHFSKGVLNVRQLLQPNPSKTEAGLEKMNGKGKRKGKRKGKGKKGKGKGKKRK